jgi:hypothetical protein
VTFTDTVRMDYVGTLEHQMDSPESRPRHLATRAWVGVDGRFAVPLMSGGYRVTTDCPTSIASLGIINVPGFLSGGTDLGDLPGPPPFELPRYAVTGRVTGLDGTAVPSAKVSAVAAGEVVSTTWTGADGTYALRVPSGAFHVWAQTDGLGGLGSSAEAVYVSDPGAIVDVRLPVSIAVSGMVTHNGHPLGIGTSACLVGLDDGSVPPTSCAWVEGGHFAFAGVAPGRYQLRVDDYRTDPVTRDSEPLVRDVVVTGGATSVDASIATTSAGAVTGRVVDAVGHPVAGVPIDAMAADGRNFLTYTAADGTTASDPTWTTYRRIAGSTRAFHSSSASAPTQAEPPRPDSSS